MYNQFLKLAPKTSQLKLFAKKQYMKVEISTLLNQTAIGAINREPFRHRNNFMAGHAEKAEITPNDQKIIDAISPTLKENGLSFVGIDIIDNHLIEINVTSPTGIQEMNKLNKTNLQKTIINEMENTIKEKTHA